MSKCKFYDKGKCTFKLKCSYEREGLCNAFDRFDIKWRDKDAMRDAIKQIRELLNDTDIDME